MDDLSLTSPVRRHLGDIRLHDFSRVSVLVVTFEKKIDRYSWSSKFYTQKELSTVLSELITQNVKIFYGVWKPEVCISFWEGGNKWRKAVIDVFACTFNDRMRAFNSPK